MSSLPPEKICDNPKESSLTVSLLREIEREKIEKEEEEESPPLPKIDIAKRSFSVENLCNFNMLNENLEAEINRDIVKCFQVHEKEKLS